MLDKLIIGKIYTCDAADSVVEAIGIEGDKIVYTGDKAGAEALAGNGTEMITLEADQVVIPGFMDGHCHILPFSSMSFITRNITEAATDGSPEMILDEMKPFLKEQPDSPFYIGKNWKDSSFENNCPTADILDRLDTDKPVVMIDMGGHSYWVNSAMIKLAGITKDTPNPVGGVIERYPDGTPNGCFRDTATGLIQTALPVVGPKLRLPGLLAAQKVYENMGYTAMFDALTNEQSRSLEYPVIEACEMLDKEDKLNIYVQGSYVINNDATVAELVKKGIELVRTSRGGMFEVRALKIFLDGVVEGATAYLSEPYACNPDSYGSNRWPGEESFDRLVAIVTAANNAGIPCHVHTIGDAAVTRMLDVFEAVYRQIGEKERSCRNAMTHLQVVKPTDIPRFKELGVYAVINPWGYKATGMFETEVRNLGEKRAEEEYPYRSLLDAGAHVSFATDYGCSFVADPIECFHVLTTRTAKNDDPATVLNAAERFTRKEALRIMTRNVAEQMRVEDRFGSLEAGKAASLDILSKDILTVPDTEIMSATVLSAMSCGKWIKR